MEHNKILHTFFQLFCWVDSK